MALPFETTYPHLEHLQQNPDELQLLGAIITDAGTLKDALQSSAEAESIVSEYEFWTPPEIGLSLPDSITNTCGYDLRSAVVTTRTENDLPPTFSLTLCFATKEYHTSRSHEEFSSAPLETAIINTSNREDAVVSGEPLTQTDLNRIICMLALGGPISHNDIAHLEGTDLSSPEKSEALVDLLEQTANVRRKHVSYNLSDNRSMQWSTEHGPTGDTVLDWRLVYETGSHNRTIEAVFSIGAEIKLAFHTREDAPPVDLMSISSAAMLRDDISLADAKQPLITDTGDRLRLYEIINEEIQRVEAQTEVILIDPHTIGQLARIAPPDCEIPSQA